MGPAEIRGLYLIFGAAVVLVTLLLGAMHLRAWALREALGLNALARFELRQEVFVYGGITALGLVSLGTAALELGIGWGLPIWVFLLSPVVVIVERVATSELRRSLATGGSKSGG